MAEQDRQTDGQNERERREHVFRGNTAIMSFENFPFFQVFHCNRFWGRRPDKQKHRMKRVEYLSGWAFLAHIDAVFSWLQDFGFFFSLEAARERRAVGSGRPARDGTVVTAVFSSCVFLEGHRILAGGTLN